MKYVLPVVLSSLFTLTACNPGSSETKRTCTFNGEAIACAEENSQTAPSTRQIRDDKVRLKAGIKSGMDFDGRVIKILENTYSSDEETVSDEIYECVVDTKAGDEYHITYTKSGMILEFDDEEELVFTKNVSASWGQREVWQNEEVDEDGARFNRTLILEKNSLEIQVQCEY